MRRVAQLRRSVSFVAPPSDGPATHRECSILDEQSFQRMIAVERKRTERSRQPFLLVLLEAGNCLASDTDGTVFGQVLSALSLATRETDVTGWYKAHSIVGVLFPEIELDSTLTTVMSRVRETARGRRWAHRPGVARTDPVPQLSAITLSGTPPSIARET